MRLPEHLIEKTFGKKLEITNLPDSRESLTPEYNKYTNPALTERFNPLLNSSENIHRLIQKSTKPHPRSPKSTIFPTS